MDEEIILEKRYSIPYEMFGNAFSAFQKRYVYPRSIIMAIVFVIAAAANIISIVMGKSSNLAYLLVFVCLALAAVNLINPGKIKKKLMESLEGIDEDVYRMKLSADKLVIGTVLEEVTEEKPKEEYEEVFEETEPQEEIKDSEITLNSTVEVMDKPEYFMVYIKKAMFYVIPKKDFSEEEITIMQLHFQKQLDKNYKKYEK